jgi:MFS family permease
MGIGTVIGSLIGFSIYGFGIGKGWADTITFLPIVVYALSNFYGGIRFKYSVNETIRIQTPSEIEKEPVNRTRVSVRQAIPMLFTGFGLLIAIIFIESINNMIYRPFIQIYLVSIFVDPTVVMLMYIPAGIIGLFLAPKLGQLIDRVRPILGIIFSILLGAGVTYLFIIISNRYIMSILLIIDTLAIGILSLSVQNLLSRISTSHRGKIMGIQSLVGNIGSIIGPIVGGWLADIYVLRTPFYVSIFVELSLIPLYWVATKIITPLLAEKKQIEYSIEVKREIP